MPSIIEVAKEALRIEAEAIEALIARIDERFEEAVALLYNCKGKVVVTGIGKPSHIGKKIAATLASTGTSAFFMHPAEAAHGDSGMIGAKDVVIAISNSGETSELLNIIPIIHKIGAPIIAICGNVNSTLAKNSVVTLDAKVEREADPLNLAPTASSTAELALGDALAMAVHTKRGFTAEDFALFHPGGSLGRQLSGIRQEDEGR